MVLIQRDRYSGNRDTRDGRSDLGTVGVYDAEHILVNDTRCGVFIHERTRFGNEESVTISDFKLILTTYYAQNDDARLLEEASKIDFGLTLPRTA